MITSNPRPSLEHRDCSPPRQLSGAGLNAIGEWGEGTTTTGTIAFVGSGFQGTGTNDNHIVLVKSDSNAIDGRDEEHFTYAIKMESALPTGAKIQNMADITCDGGLTISTNTMDPRDLFKGTGPAKDAWRT